jgi:MoaA/NifB/PqqE/SkfB family radical SAM enzyme
MNIMIKNKDLYLFSKLCNLKCEICSEDINLFLPKIINLKDIKDTINKFKVNVVYIRGGELFLYENYKGLLDILEKYKVFIATNGFNTNFVVDLLNKKNIIVEFKILTTSFKYKILTGHDNSLLLESLNVVYNRNKKYNIIIKYINDLYSLNDDFLEYRKYIIKSQNTYFIGFDKKFKHNYRDVMNFPNVIYLDKLY